MITTVIFDLDDTLYDEIEYCKSGFRAIADFLSKVPDAPAAERIYNALFSQFEAGNRTKTFDTALDELEMPYDREFIGKLVELYRNHIPAIMLPRDSLDVLSLLDGKYTLSLLTDGFLPAQRLKVEALKIGKFFGRIVYTEELGRECWKPSPAGFERIIRELNINYRDAAYVADNEIKDFIAPNSLGIGTIRLIRPAGIHRLSSEQAGAAAQYTIQEISRLPDLLARL